jgi:hypothetical protein
MSNLPEQHNDASARLKAAPDQKHMHRINLGVHPGTAKRTDFNPAGVETPARVSRARVNPADAAKQRRTPLIDVTAITPSASGNHTAEPPPAKL